MRRVDVVLAGYGRVGRALVALLLERGALVRQRYGLDLRLRRVITSRGPLDLPCGELLGGDVPGGAPPGAPGLRGAPGGRLPGRDLADGARRARGEVPVDLPGELSRVVEGDVLVDATPTDLVSGQPGLAYLRGALGAGVHGVALSKGPLVVGWMELHQLALQRGVRLMVSGATAAALPAADTLLYSLAGAKVLSIEGVLNGTTNYVLGRMEEGLAYHEALAEAQARGIAEPDPRLDVEGWDTAAKMVILANLAWATSGVPGDGGASGAGWAGRAATLADVRVTGITALAPEDLARSRRQGRVLRLVGRAVPAAAPAGVHAGSGGATGMAPVATADAARGAVVGAGEGGDVPRIEVGPGELSPDHPLARLTGANKGVTFVTDLMGSVTVTGGESNPRAAAAAALKDLIHLYL